MFEGGGNNCKHTPMQIDVPIDWKASSLIHSKSSWFDCLTCAKSFQKLQTATVQGLDILNGGTHNIPDHKLHNEQDLNLPETTSKGKSFQSLREYNSFTSFDLNRPKDIQPGYFASVAKWKVEEMKANELGN